ncbi:MAG: hypothetical protein F8N37_18650 [Telmatospirillum sp.]|nr:hypothetical protein [Telmatospirillum sp.]
MDHLFIFNDSPYGNQRTFNGLRLAQALSRKTPIRVFLFGDGVTAGLAGLAPAHADYNPQDMLQAIAASGGEIAACGTCMEARGLTRDSLIAAVSRGSLDQLVDWTLEAEKVITF